MESERMTRVMGIVNVTPDSFSDGGKYFRPEEAVRRALNLIDEGADIIDIGAESTRPGSVPISWEEEWSRLEPVLKGLSPLFELDSYAPPVIMMAPVPGDTLDPEVEKRYRAALGFDGKIEQVERFAFYERAKKAYAVVLTGETAKYGNIIIKKGVIPVAK